MTTPPVTPDPAPAAPGASIPSTAAIRSWGASRQSLDGLFSPRSIAIVGASEKPGSVGASLIANLDVYDAPKYLINPSRTRVAGRPAFPDLRSLPEVVDLAIIATPAHTVPDLVESCGSLGVRAAIVISAGFREAGPAGLALEARVRQSVSRSGLRLLGPNCLGAMVPHLGLNATFANGMAKPGSVAFLSQSGALCTAVLDWSFDDNVGFSAFVSVGGMLNVGWGDLIDHFGRDPNTRSIVIYMESVGDARSFLSAARETAFTKPIIVLKVGRSSEGARAAASHTGSMTGSDVVLDAALRRAGVLRVDTISELFEMAELLAKQPRPRGPRLAVITNAGGPGALASDALVAAGACLAPISSQTRETLSTFLPQAWSHGNPVDVLGDAEPPRYTKAVETVMADPAVDGGLLIVTPQSTTDPTRTAQAIVGLSRPAGKPLLASWMGGACVREGIGVLNQGGIPTYPFPDSAARAYALMWRYSQNLELLYETPSLSDQGGPKDAMTRAAAILDDVRRAGRSLLTETESKQVLAAYGLDVAETRVAATEDAAAAMAVALGFPVVLKLSSSTITHKAKAGGVRLNLHDEGSVRDAWRSIREAVTSLHGNAAFEGVSVQPMLPAGHAELLLGSLTDPQFGPVVVVGSGGRLVEALNDKAVGLPPLTDTLARRMLEQTRIYRGLLGLDNPEGTGMKAVTQAIVRISRLIIEQPRIAELDINPLHWDGTRATVLDARIVLHPALDPATPPPRPAIRPYPAEYIQTTTARDGTHLTLRPIRPDDEPAVVRFQGELSETSVYYRYFSAVPLKERTAHPRLARLCFADYIRQLPLVAEGGVAGDRRIVGLAHLHRQSGGEAEFAVAVADGWQQRGVGTALMSHLIAVARSEGIIRVSGVVLADNRQMLELCGHLGFIATQDTRDGTELKVSLAL